MNWLIAFLLILSPSGETPCKSWPYASYTEAKAYTYNLRNAGPGMDWRIIREENLNPTARGEQKLSEEDAAAFARQINRIKGTRILSKCFFPRHAVVYYDAAGKPIGGIEICFTCQDVRVWPEHRRHDPDANPYVEVKPENEEDPMYELSPRLQESWDFMEHWFRSHKFPVFKSERELSEFLREVN